MTLANSFKKLRYEEKEQNFKTRKSGVLKTVKPRKHNPNKNNNLCIHSQ